MTSLIEWKGNLTGIPRTVDEIAIRLKDHPNVEFVQWSFRYERFELVDIEHYYNEVAPANRAFFKQHPEKVGAKSQLTVAGVVKKVVRSSRILSKSAEVTIGSAKRIRRARQIRQAIPGLQLGKNATLFVPCGLWDNESYIRAVLDYKQAGAQLVFLSYDLLPIVVPQFSGQWGAPMKDFTDRVTSVCDLVFSISDYTKQDLRKYLKSEKLTVPKISTIRLGDAFSSYESIPPSDKKFARTKILETKEDFILCTGTIEARKNHTLLYYVYKLAASRGIELPRLIVAGRPGYRTQDIQDIIEDDPEVNDKITLLRNVSDEELSWLYDNCKFTVYPSFYEGWGLPIAESVAKGVPCIASNTSSMPEVAPGFAEYFNPASAEECLTAIQAYQDDKKLQQAKDRLKKYKPASWDETYEQVIRELNKL